MHSRTVPSCILAWFQRYVAAELLATGVVLLAAVGAPLVHPSAVVAAVLGGCGESLAFYGVMLARELRRRGGAHALPAAVRDLAIEFGPAEVLDTLCRPALLYAGAYLLPDLAAGLVAGKLAADGVFYGSAILCSALHSRVRRQPVCQAAQTGSLAIANH